MASSMASSFSPGSSRQPRSGHAPQPTTPSGVPTHPGKQLSAVFVGRPRGRLNTDHDTDADRVRPNSGQPGNTTPRGPSPPRIHSLMSAACTRVRPPHILLCNHRQVDLSTTFGHSAPAHHATYIPVLYTRHVLPHIYTTTQIVHKAPLHARSRHTTARSLRTTHVSCTQIHSLLCPKTTTKDAGVGGWSFAIFPRKAAIWTLLLFSAGLGSRLTLGRLPPQGKNPVGRLPPTTSRALLLRCQIRRPPGCARSPRPWATPKPHF